jgi:hypothetical protein
MEMYPIKLRKLDRQCITSQHIYPSIHSYLPCMFLLYVTVFLNPAPQSHVNGFQSVGHKLKVNNYYVPYYAKLSV